MPTTGFIHADVLAAIGSTPLVRLRRMARDLNVYVKLEFMNPSGSIKDRLAAAVITDAEVRGVLKPGGTIIEATGGNTGPSLAMVGATKGYHVVIVMPSDAPEETRRRLRAFGAEVASSSPAQGMAGANALARRLASERPDSFLVDQFTNPAAVRAHRDGTGREIAEAAEIQQVDAFVAGVGTGATLMGVAEGLRQRWPGVLIVAVEPAHAPILSKGEAGAHRIAGLGPSFVPPLFRRDLVTRIMGITDEQAQSTAAALAKEEGLFCGPSSGANVAAALQMAGELGPSKIVVTVLPDGGNHYLRSIL